MQRDNAYDVIVIGGGTAGLVTASGCARLGRRVALIERHALGGDCLWTGCVPTKALVASARLAHQMRNASRFGLESSEPRFTPAAVMESMREAQRVTARHDDPEKFRQLGIDVVAGDAVFVAADRVRVGERVLSAKDIVIATGSRTALPPIEGLGTTGFVDHASFLSRDSFPASVIVLGGGAIGIEFSQILRRFGCDVTLVEMLDVLAPKEDAEVSERIREILTSEGIVVRTGWSAKSARNEEGQRVLRIENKAGVTEEVRAGEIFVASGRRGNIETLGLDAIGVATERSWVVVDRYLQTSVARIWAAGDVHGGLQFTHVAAYEAVKLVRNMLFPGKSAVRYDNVPRALYTDPEVASVGMTEAEAIAEHGRANVRTFRCELAEVDRAVVDRATSGFVKLIADRKGRILGAHAIAPHASTLIESIVVARRAGTRISDIAQLVAPYPSLGDALQKAAAQHYSDLAGKWLGRLAKRIAALAQ